MKKTPGGSGVKNPPADTRDTRDVGLIPGWGRSSGVGNGNPLEYSCLQNPVDWRATVHRIAESQTELSSWALTSYSTDKGGEGWARPQLGKPLGGCHYSLGRRWRPPAPSLVKMQKRRQMEDGKETELRDLVADRSGVWRRRVSDLATRWARGPFPEFCKGGRGILEEKEYGLQYGGGGTWKRGTILLGLRRQFRAGDKAFRVSGILVMAQAVGIAETICAGV